MFNIIKNKINQNKETTLHTKSNLKLGLGE